MTKFSVAELMQKTQTLIDSLDFELAEKFCMRALSIEPSNVEILEVLAFICTDLGKFDQAKDALCEIIRLQPDYPYPYFQLGQLREGLEAISLYEKGLERVEKELVSSNDHLELRKSASNACCAVVEIYMSECCDEVDAETKCDFYAQRAVEIDSSNPDAYHTLASLRFTQGRTDEAKALLFSSCKLWIPIDVLSQLESWQGMGEEQPALGDMPQFSSRVTLAKLTIEMEIFDLSLLILDTLQEENDEDLEVLYLYAMVYWLIGCREVQNNLPSEIDAESALQEYVEKCASGELKLDELLRDLWESGFEYLKQAKKVIEMQGGIVQDEQLMTEARDLYETLSAVLAHNGR